MSNTNVLQITSDELRDLRNDVKKEALQLQIAGDTREPSPRSGRQHPIPRYGVGGYEDNPFDDFGNYRGPIVPGHPGWASSGQDLMIAHEPGNTRGVLENTGAVVKPDGKTWLLPTKDGKYREATEEETINILEQLKHEDENRWWQQHDHNQADAEAATKHLQKYQGKDGSLNHHSPEMRKLILHENVGKYRA